MATPKPFALQGTRGRCQGRGKFGRGSRPLCRRRSPWGCALDCCVHLWPTRLWSAADDCLRTCNRPRLSAAGAWAVAARMGLHVCKLGTGAALTLCTPLCMTTNKEAYEAPLSRNKTQQSQLFLLPPVSCRQANLRMQKDSTDFLALILKHWAPTQGRRVQPRRTNRLHSSACACGPSVLLLPSRSSLPLRDPGLISPF